MNDEPKRLTNDRNSLGTDFERGPAPAGHELGSSDVDHPRSPAANEADPSLRERHRLGESYADPNAGDDQRLGKSFEETNRSGRHPREKSRRLRQPINWRRLSLVLVAIVVIFLLVFLAGILPRRERDKRTAARAREHGSALPEIRATQVRRSPHAAGLVLPGTTAPLIESYVYARANGYLARRLVDIGDHVRQGQLLAVIDAPDLDQQVDQARQQVRQAESQLSQQQTQLALTKITNDRWRVLVAKGVFSRQDGDQREADYRAQLANVAAAERNVEAFRSNLRRLISLQSYKRVTAPFTGVITQRNVDVGALISAQGTGQGASSSGASQSSSPTQLGGTNTAGSSGNAPALATPSTGGTAGGPLFSVAQDDRLRILVSVPEGYAGAVHTGQTVELHFQELSGAQFTGKVTRTSASIDQNTRTLLTEVLVANADHRLLSGMYAVATFAGAAGEGPLTISGDSIAVRNARNVVAVIEDGQIHLQPVDVGRDFGPVVEIVGGLHEGQTIATDITDDVREGARINAKLQPDSNDQGPAPPAQNAPPGGSSQYGDQSSTDRNLQGQAAQGGGRKQGKSKGKTSGESKQ